MTFYSRYTAWSEAMSNLIVALCAIESKEGWEHIVNDESEIQKQLKIVVQYNFWNEFEEFALANDKLKVDGFFKSTDVQFAAWLSFWERVFNHETEKEFTDFFFKIVFRINKILDFKEYNLIIKLSNKTNQELRDSFNAFEEIKVNYTSLPPTTPKLFYYRVRSKLISKVKRTTRRYTYKDWLNGGIDEILVRDYLDSGEDIVRLVRPSKWEYFNKWLETRFRQPITQCTEEEPFGSSDPFAFRNYTYEELKDMIVNRLLYHEGNSLMLFTHAAVSLFPPEELGKINECTEEIHNKIVADNWYHFKKHIDHAVNHSAEPEKLINMSIDSIERYLNGEPIDLSYPVSNATDIEQKEISAAYNYLLKGFRETRYVRPKKRGIEEWPIDNEENDYVEYHIDHRSPFVEAELYIKAKKYLKQISEQPVKTSPLLRLSYQWLDSAESLASLYDLIKDILINDTRKEDFIDAFSGKPIGSFKPIKWKSSNATELLYFLIRMMPGLIADERKRMDYQRLIVCFVKSDGGLFDANILGPSKQQVDTLSHVKKKVIDDWISMFL